MTAELLPGIQTPFFWDADHDPRHYLPDGHRAGWPVARVRGVLDAIGTDTAKKAKKDFLTLRDALEKAEQVRSDNDFSGLLDQLQRHQGDRRGAWERLQKLDFSAFDDACTNIASTEQAIAELAVSIIDAAMPVLLDAFIADCKAMEARLVALGEDIMTSVMRESEQVVEYTLYADPLTRREFFSLWGLQFYFRREFVRPKYEPERPALRWLNSLFA
jgi:hypothetical protein